MAATKTFPLSRSAHARPTTGLASMKLSARLGMSPMVVTDRDAVSAFCATAEKDVTARYAGPGTAATTAGTPAHIAATSAAALAAIRLLLISLSSFSWTAGRPKRQGWWIAGTAPRATWAEPSALAPPCQAGSFLGKDAPVSATVGR